MAPRTSAGGTRICWTTPAAHSISCVLVLDETGDFLVVLPVVNLRDHSSTSGASLGVSPRGEETTAAIKTDCGLPLRMRTVMPPFLWDLDP